MPGPSNFERKNIRLSAGRYRGPGAFFVTLCFHNRRRFGANPRLAAWLVDRLRKNAAVCGFDIHAYCVMPDHMHLLATTSAEESNLTKLVESFKQETAFEFMRRTHLILWQFKYYDRILRAADAVDRVAWYIWQNPVRQGLCRTPADYPFLGSFTEIGGKILKSSCTGTWTPPWKIKRRFKRSAAVFSAAPLAFLFSISPTSHLKSQIPPPKALPPAHFPPIPPRPTRSAHFHPS